MPNYEVRSCLGDGPISSVIESTTPLSIGDIVSYDNSGTVYCGFIFNDTDLFPDSTLLVDTFTSCCQCLTAPDGVNFTSYDFKKCNTEEVIKVDINVFCESTNIVPQVGNIYQISNVDSGLILCVELIGATFSRTEIWNFKDGPEVSCETCQNKIFNYPRSANTEVLVCEVCCPCDISGSTFTVTPPNPVWTDGSGIAVTQLNMIVLGGENGLNN